MSQKIGIIGKQSLFNPLLQKGFALINFSKKHYIPRYDCGADGVMFITPHTH